MADFWRNRCYISCSWQSGLLQENGAMADQGGGGELVDTPAFDEAGGATNEESAVLFERDDDATLLVRLIGVWSLDVGLPSIADLERQLSDGATIKRLAFDAGELGTWDSALVTFVAKTCELAHDRGVAVDLGTVPQGLKRLLDLAEAVPQTKGVRAGPAPAGLFTRIGRRSIGYGRSINESLAFLGEFSIALVNFLRGRARYQFSDLALTMQQCGANALGIVSLISFLVGVILAFMGAVQLEKVGAQIFVANLVAIGMVREMGAMMTAIIMAGRTGAAFAAQLGTMKVTQEIDALETMGIPPMEFLVLPRVIALVVMMPLLCAYSDFLGIMGGAAVGSVMLHLSLRSYLDASLQAIELTSVFGGLFKAATYGVLIALAGCLRGFQCGSSSSAVGEAATSAVVTSIVLVVSACGVFAVVFNILGL
jgi:phospholipid/cholesterol/gamma-HCH transport system permease protein